MELHYVNYYNQFRCIGPECEDTCCAVWGIEIDDKTYEKYKNCQGKWGKRFASSIDEEQCFHMKKDSKECIFLNDKHLCDIQAEFGEDMLCRTCKMFPRHMEDYGERREFMLSLACPEAARMILFKTEPATLYKRVKERRIPEENKVDEELLAALIKLREAILEILHKQNVNIVVRTSMMLALAHDANSRIRRRDWTALDEVLERYTREGAVERFERKLEERMQRDERECQSEQEKTSDDCAKVLEGTQQQMKKYLHMLEGLELLDEKWSAYLSETQKLLYEEETDESYEELLYEFWRSEKKQEHIYTNIAEYFIISYLVGAVFDSDAYTKVKFALYSLLIIRELYLARYKKNRAEGKCGLENSDRVELAYWYSREVENSQNNLDALDTVLEAHPEFSLEKLMRCLLVNPMKAEEDYEMTDKVTNAPKRNRRNMP